VAENFDDTPAAGDVEQAKTKRLRGRPHGITDAELIANRNFLVWLVENTWGSVGLELHRVKSPDGVRLALKEWERYQDQNALVGNILRPTTHSMDIKRLRALQLRRTRLVDSLYEADERRKQCQERLQKVEIIFVHQLTEEQRIIAEEERVKRKTALEGAENEYSACLQNLNKVSEEIKDGHAHVTRIQVVQFCRSARYSITPVNIANALAGLPYIGYRQSIKRCRRQKPIHAGGIAYQIVKVLQRIVDSRRQNKTLVKDAEQWLRKLRVSKSSQIFSAVEELRNKWYYLKPAIATVVSQKPLTRELPYKITTEYFRRSDQRSPLDSFFEEECRIVPDKIVTRTE
jgi:hypothetical protein